MTGLMILRGIYTVCIAVAVFIFLLGLFCVKHSRRHDEGWVPCYLRIVAAMWGYAVMMLGLLVAIVTIVGGMAYWLYLVNNL